MGNKSKFKKEPKQFKLVFAEDDELYGLEVLMRSVSIDSFLRMSDKFAAAAGDATLSMKNQRDMFKYFSQNLIEWNLVDEYDHEVPPVLAQCIQSEKDVADDGYCADHRDKGEPMCAVVGVLAQELDFIMTLYKAWQEAMAGVPADLGKDSASGKQSPEASLPMDPL